MIEVNVEKRVTLVMDAEVANALKVLLGQHSKHSKQELGLTEQQAEDTSDIFWTLDRAL